MKVILLCVDIFYRIKGKFIDANIIPQGSINKDNLLLEFFYRLWIIKV